MKTIFRTAFYLRSNYVNKEGNTSVMARIYLNSERISIGSTGISIDAKLWDKEKERMRREEKNWLCEAVNSNTYFQTAVPLMGYRFDFFDVPKKYLVNQYGQWAEYYAPDRTSLRAYLSGQIHQIVEIPKC